MRAFFTKGLAATVLAVLAAAACGSDDNGTSGVSSGVDSSKPADQLTSSDAKAVCDAIANYATSELNADVVRRVFCTQLTAVQALTKAPTVAECNDSVSKCVMMAQPATQTGQSTSTASASCPGGTVPTGCTATVGGIQACTTAAINAARTILDGIDCSIWGLPPAEAQQKLRATPTQPAECGVVARKCAGLVSSGQSAAPAPSSS